MKQRVFIIDHELISPIAIGKQNIIESIQSNFSADRFITRTDVSGVPFKKAAEVQEDLHSFFKDESDHFKAVCAIDRKLELLAACYGLMKDRVADLVTKFDETKTGIILGIGAEAPPYEFFEKELKVFLHQRYNSINELIVSLNRGGGKLNFMNNPYDVYALYLAQKMNAGAFQKSILTACVSSTQAIALAYDSIARSQAEVVISGGTDSIINLAAMMSFGKLGVIAETDDRISCRPFDVNRFGTVAGEAAGIVILASENFVLKHKLQPFTQLTGYGNTLDGYKITAPDPSGISIERALKNAIVNSAIKTSDIDYIHAHGTGTKQNDEIELNAIRNVMGENANEVPVSSTKDRHGHAIAAAGIQELCLLLEFMKHDLMPGNLNLQNPINTEMNLLRANTSKKIKYALTSNFAFGGINTVLAVKNELL